MQAGRQAGWQADSSKRKRLNEIPLNLSFSHEVHKANIERSELTNTLYTLYQQIICIFFPDVQAEFDALDASGCSHNRAVVLYAGTYPALDI